MLARACAGKKTSLKAALLDQRVVAGLGNIYVCEALHRARLSPKRSASTIAKRTGAPHARAVRAGRRHQGRARRGHQGRRLVAARPPPDRRRARLFPAPFPGLRPRRRALPDAGLPRHRQAHRAERPLDVLLPDVPAVSRDFARIRTVPGIVRCRLADRGGRNRDSCRSSLAFVGAAGCGPGGYCSRRREALSRSRARAYMRPHHQRGHPCCATPSTMP